MKLNFFFFLICLFIYPSVIFAQSDYTRSRDSVLSGLQDDLSVYVKGLKEKIYYLEKKKESLQNELNQKGGSPNFEEEDFSKGIKEEEPLLRDSLKLKENKDFLEDKEQIFDVINLLYEEKKRLRTRLLFLHEICKELEQRLSQSLEKEQNPAITSLKEEIEILRKQLTALQQYVERKEEKINFLTSQVVELSLKLSEKEEILEENAKQLTSLSQQLTDLAARLELGQRIIQDKDRQIFALAAGQSPAGLPLESAKNAQATSWDQEEKVFLQIYQKKLQEANDSIKQKVLELNTLNNQFASWQLRFKEEQLVSDKKDKEIKALKDTIDHLRWEALEANGRFKNYFSSQNKELYELRGVLEIYKEKLRQANQLIKEKVSALNELVILGDQLATLKSRLLNPK